MKLVRFGDSGQEKPGLLDGNGRIRDLSGLVGDLSGEVLGPESLKRLKEIDPGTLPLVEGSPRLGAPVGVVPKFLGIGLNYRDHAEETGMPIPEVPIVFAKASSCVSGPNDPVLAPAAFKRMDYEVELAVVIGRRAKRVARAGALAHVAGYTIMNDVSSRDPWLDGDQWLLGKSMPGFCPVGPRIVPADALDASDLALGFRVNGVAIQDGRTSQMRFSIAEILAYLGAHIELRPGDLIATGTPARIGPEAERHLELGDVMTCWIEGIGELTNTIG